MIKATRNGIAAIFSDNDWKSGQPQRYGWREEGKEGKTLPKEIINFIERRKAPEPVEIKDPKQPLAFVTVQEQMDDLSKPGIKKELGKAIKVTKEAKVSDKIDMTKKDEQVIQTDKKIKTKANDNPKQKGRASGKHKPGAVEKA